MSGSDSSSSQREDSQQGAMRQVSGATGMPQGQPEAQDETGPPSSMYAPLALVPSSAPTTGMVLSRIQGLHARISAEVGQHPADPFAGLPRDAWQRHAQVTTSPGYTPISGRTPKPQPSHQPTGLNTPFIKPPVISALPQVLPIPPLITQPPKDLGSAKDAKMGSDPAQFSAPPFPSREEPPPAKIAGARLSGWATLRSIDVWP
jgi:hypothetical protein